MIRVSQIKLGIDEQQELLPQKMAKKLKIKASDIVSYSIFKQSIDARFKGRIDFVYTVDVKTTQDETQLLAKKLPDVSKTPDFAYQLPVAGVRACTKRPVIIGFGPAGIFAALILAQAGYQPIVLERGEAVDSRVKSVDEFWNAGILNTESNALFGEGGAGTFSDGKLTTRVKDLRGRKVLEALVAAGAPENILYEAHPHVGTDRLRDVIKRIREKITALGAEVRFNTCVTDFLIEDGAIRGVKTKAGQTINTPHVILAVGHSARDVFETLLARQVALEAKPFAVGVRIEHPQALIDRDQYKEFAGHPRLGAASYRLTHKASSGRGVYTFCMCPGGVVVPSASAAGYLVTNGMSYHARDGANANSALIVTVTPDDFASSSPLAGIKFQKVLEEKAFELGGSNYKAPVQLVGDFLENRASKGLGEVMPTYFLGVKLANLNELFPPYISDALKEGIMALDQKLKGFAMDDAVLTAVESRTSSPIRVVRDGQTCASVSTKGLYPAGEGSGYAGGIVSAAIDGIKCAEALMRQCEGANVACEIKQ